MRDEQNLGQILTHPTFSPVTFSKPTLAGRGKEWATPTYTRRPSSSIFQWLCSESGVGSGTTVITVGQPSMIRLLRFLEGIALTDTSSLDIFWRPLGERGDPLNLYGNFNSARRQPFTGPYVWLPDAGQYQLCAQAQHSLGTPLTMRAELQVDTSREQFDQVVRANSGSHWASRTSANMALGATTSAIADVHNAYFLVRRIQIENTGAGQLDVIFGTISGAPVSRFTLAPGEVRDFGPEICGRSTISCQAIAATSFTSVYGLW